MTIRTQAELLAFFSDTPVIQGRYTPLMMRELIESLPSVAGGVISVMESRFGAKADGVTDDRAAFNAASAVSGPKTVPYSGAAYKIGSSITLTGVWHIAAGALLKPALGVTITFDASARVYIETDWAGAFDTSAGGALRFATGSKLYDPESNTRALSEERALVSAAQMRDSLAVTDPTGSIMIDYVDGATRHIYTPLDGVTYALRWKMKTATSGAWCLSGVSAVRMFAAWDDTEVGITYAGGTWPAASLTGTALGGGYRSTSSTGFYAEWTITGFTELWIAHAKRTNGGIAYVLINGATTLVNELPLVGINRELSMYAAVDDHNGYTKVASGLNPATTYTIRVTSSGVNGAGGGHFIHFSGYGYPSADLTDTRVTATINNAILDRQFSDLSYIWEYAYEIAPIGSSNYLFSGMKHELEALVSTAFQDENGATVTVALAGPRRAVVGTLTCVQSLTTRHTDTGTTDYATVLVEQRFTSKGLEVWHKHTWLVATGIRFTYAAMFAFDDSVTEGQVAGDYGNVYDLSHNDDSTHGSTYSRCAAMWNPAYSWVGWLYMPDFDGVEQFLRTSSLKLWEQDRSISGGLNRDKIYFTRTEAASTVAAGDVWENTARYRVSRITDIATRFPLVAP